MGTDPAAAARQLARCFVLLVLFGVVFGYVEAAAVLYIRASYEPIHQRLHPERAPDDLTPLLTLDQWAREGPAHTQPPLELGREIGTLLLVALMALGVSRDVREWFASFLLAFGVWDLSYYPWLRLLSGWPHSLLDWDLVFAVPVPWVSPVLAPLLVAAVMTVAAAVFFWAEATGRPIRPRWGHWAAVLAGGLVMLVAFWWDWRNTLAGGVPGPFNWPLLLLGLAVGGAGFIHAGVRAFRRAEGGGA